MNRAPESAARPAAVLAGFAAIYLIWGSTYLAIRVAVATLPPFLLAGARFLLAGAVLATWLACTRGFRPTRRQWRDNAIIGALLLLGGNGLVVWAEQAIPSGLAALIISITPLMFVLFDWLHPRGARPAPAIFLGIALGFAGLLLLAGPGGAVAFDPRHCAGLILASCSWAAGSLWSRYAREPAAPLTGAAVQMLCGGVWLLLAGLAGGEAAQLVWAQVTFRSVAAWAYLVGVGSLVAFPTYIWLLKHSTPARVSTYAYVNPVIAVFLGWWLLREPVAPRTLLASAVIVASVALITTQKHRPKSAA